MLFQLVLQACGQNFICFYKQRKTTNNHPARRLTVLFRSASEVCTRSFCIASCALTVWGTHPYISPFPSHIILRENELHILLICPCSTSLPKSFRILSPAYFVLTFPRFCAIRKFHHLITYSFFRTTDMLHKFNKIGANDDNLKAFHYSHPSNLTCFNSQDSYAFHTQASVYFLFNQTKYLSLCHTYSPNRLVFCAIPFQKLC